jgi:hypothetical protein
MLFIYLMVCNPYLMMAWWPIHYDDYLCLWGFIIYLVNLVWMSNYWSLFSIVLVKSFGAIFSIRREKLKSLSLVPWRIRLGDELWDQLLFNWFAYRGRHTSLVVWLSHIISRLTILFYVSSSIRISVQFNYLRQGCYQSIYGWLYRIWFKSRFLGHEPCMVEVYVGWWRNHSCWYDRDFSLVNST